jgi:diaminohydroxyphosphoribosylaminopyrimidine deaminase/5-amino-6-(5-phosphoribosylamino)uracil reductase
MKISGPDGNRLNVSNKYSNRLVHRWRSEEAAILIGTNTAEKDNPQLTNRLWPGKSPLRVILDQNLRLPDTLHVFDASVPTIVLNGIRDFRADGIKYKKIQFENPVIPAILSTLHDEHILSVLVEGGSTLLQHFIDSKIWDEIRIIRNRELNIPKGISSPDFQYVQFQREEIYGSDSIRYYKNEYDLNAPEFI